MFTWLDCLLRPKFFPTYNVIPPFFNVNCLLTAESIMEKPDMFNSIPKLLLIIYSSNIQVRVVFIPHTHTHHTTPHHTTPLTHHMYACIHTPHTHTHTHTQTSMHAYTHHTHTDMYARIHTPHTQTCMHAYIHHTHRHVCTHTHIQLMCWGILTYASMSIQVLDNHFFIWNKMH